MTFYYDKFNVDFFKFDIVFCQIFDPFMVLFKIIVLII